VAKVAKVKGKGGVGGKDGKGGKAARVKKAARKRAAMMAKVSNDSKGNKIASDGIENQLFL